MELEQSIVITINTCDLNSILLCYRNYLSIWLQKQLSSENCKKQCGQQKGIMNVTIFSG